MLWMAGNCIDLFAIFNALKLACVFRFQYGVAFARVPFRSLMICCRDTVTFILN